MNVAAGCEFFLGAVAELPDGDRMIIKIFGAALSVIGDLCALAASSTGLEKAGIILGLIGDLIGFVHEIADGRSSSKPRHRSSVSPPHHAKEWPPRARHKARG